MKDYESGDLIPAAYVERRRAHSVISPDHPYRRYQPNEPEDSQETAMVIRKIPFKEICERADEELLEYDIDDMWQVYRKTGCYEVLHNANLIWWWPRDEQVKES